MEILVFVIIWYVVGYSSLLFGCYVDKKTLVIRDFLQGLFLGLLGFVATISVFYYLHKENDSVREFFKNINKRIDKFLNTRVI